MRRVEIAPTAGQLSVMVGVVPFVVACTKQPLGLHRTQRREWPVG